MKRQLRPPIWRRWLVRLADPFGGLDDWVLVTRSLPCPETVMRAEAEHRYGAHRVLSVEPVITAETQLNANPTQPQRNRRAKTDESN